MSIIKKKLILFDWGNIVESHLTGYSCYDAYNDLFRTCGYAGCENIHNLLGKYNICSIKNEEEFEELYKSIKEEFHLTKTYNEFKYLYKKIFDNIDYYKDVAEYEISLKDRCYIGILSDLTILDYERLNKQVNLSNYDYIFLSFEMGLQKPDIKLFNEVQKMLPFSKQDILFIDDRKDIVDAALKFGWNTLQATGLELDKIKKKCEEFLMR